MYFVFPLYCERPNLCNIFTESFWKDLYLFGTKRFSAVSWTPISRDDLDSWPLFQIWTDPSGYCIIIVIRLSVRLSRAFFCGICLSGNLKLIWNIQQHWKNQIPKATRLKDTAFYAPFFQHILTLAQPMRYFPLT